MSERSADQPTNREASPQPGVEDDRPADNAHTDPQLKEIDPQEANKEAIKRQARHSSP